MKLKVQKRLAADVLKCSKKRVHFNPERLEDIKESITKADIKGLIADHAISAHPEKSVSRGRAKLRQTQRRKGRQKGFGSRKGKGTARTEKKRTWINKIRKQRQFLSELKEKKLLDTLTYRGLYQKAKGGFFRSVRHIKLYITDRKIIKK